MSDRREYQKQYREQNKEKIKEQQRLYREKNKEKQKEYREKNKEKQKEYREKNKEKQKESKKKYDEKQKEEINYETINFEFRRFDQNRVLTTDQYDNYAIMGIKLRIPISEREKRKMEKYKVMKRGLRIADEEEYEYFQNEFDEFCENCKNEYLDYLKTIPDIPLEFKKETIEKGRKLLEKQKEEEKEEKEEEEKEIEYPQKIKDAMQFYESQQDPKFLYFRKPWYFYIKKFPNSPLVDKMINRLYNGPE